MGVDCPYVSRGPYVAQPRTTLFWSCKEGPWRAPPDEDTSVESCLLFRAEEHGERPGGRFLAKSPELDVTIHVQEIRAARYVVESFDRRG